MAWIKRSTLCLVCVGTPLILFLSVVDRDDFLTASSKVHRTRTEKVLSPLSYSYITATPSADWIQAANWTRLTTARPPSREDGKHSDDIEHREHAISLPGGSSIEGKSSKKSRPGEEGSRAVRRKSYSREFEWNDRDPNGWKTLPLSTGEPGEEGGRVIFNRVGKCGSRSMISLIRELTERNDFNLISSLVYSRTNVPTDWAKHIVSVLDRAQTPYIFQRHLHYLDFRRHNASEVVYINIIRDPVERLVSHYYFSRFGDGQNKVSRANSRKSETEFRETIDDCVRNRHRDCIGHRTFYIIPFFCGNVLKCMKPSQWALNQAIHNVQKHYIVVGVLEEFELTVRVLEGMLPRFFAGATELYHAGVTQKSRSRTVTHGKIPPSNETTVILQERMKYEYAFYNFIRNRLHIQAERLE